MGDVIAIDGPSASGKSTVSRRVAESMGYTYVDSGAVYRAVTWLALKRGIEDADEDALLALLRDCSFESVVERGRMRFTVEGVALGPELRSEAVNENVSPVSAVPCVRRQVVRWLRAMARFGDLVMEGRDIGTAVFPEAAHKFYLDASAEERARRRHGEVAGRGSEAGMESVKQSLERRDRIDSSRKADPLRVAEGALVIDTTTLAIDEVVQRILDRVRDR